MKFLSDFGGLLYVINYTGRVPVNSYPNQVVPCQLVPKPTNYIELLLLCNV